ncbi:MAG: hypothetical protein JEZ14_09310 [Marinilabiliaceae bacterium]|nr:hypothetical protein [Marinilabiliaceae bacterium]
MSKLAILHYLPLEYYPPVTNLIDYIANERSEDFKRVKVFSCKNVKGRIDFKVDKRFVGQEVEGKRVQGARYEVEEGKEYEVECDIKSEVRSQKSRKVKCKTHGGNNLSAKNYQLLTIFRSSFPKETDNNLTRLFKYLHFNLITIVSLITYRPTDLLYFESYSAWPAYIYTRYFNRNCRLFIHNHEYASKQWYTTTMRQVKYFHSLEKKWLYPQAIWISQTNEDRLKFFHQDHPNLKQEQLKIMPNYPPRSWKVNLEDNGLGEGRKTSTSQQHISPNTDKLKPLKLVYVGSLSFQTTYLKELCEWVLNHNGKVQFDIYAYNLYEDVKTYLNELGSSFINYFEQGIEYNDQPKVLSQYDVGLILYKAHNPNYTYNAPNKLFEYLACDLDVWYPHVLKGPQPYNTANTYPKVIPVYFEQLNQFDWKTATDRSRCKHQPSKYFCEEVYSELIDEIVK